MKASDTLDDVTDGTTYKRMTAEERAKLSGIATGAEVNQNAFSKVKVGSTTINASSKTDALEIAAGDGITLSVSGKKVIVSETYLDLAVVSSLDNVPKNMRNGSLIILKG